LPPTYCNPKQNGGIFIAKLIVAEKPSVAMAYAKVLGVTSRQDGYLEGNGYLVSWCIGHLVELAPPNVYDEKYVKWSIADLPILPERWLYLVSASTKKQFGILQKLMNRPDVDSIVNSCDSGREGELIFRLVYQQADCKKPFSRLWLSSMEENAIREGFAHLKPSTEYDALYNAALCRERADWMVGMFKEVADIKTSDQLHLPVPEAKFETVVAKPSDLQKEMVQELSKRAARIHSGTVDASEDNMLCVTNDGRKIGLDVRLMNPMLPDDPNSKLNICVRNVLKIWEEGKDQKLTQLLFCDLSTPKNDGNFNVYEDIRKKLIAAGVPENEIEFIHNADTEAKKAALFSKVRSGDVRVLLGSTAKMGAGTNVQSRLVAVHHLDVGWKPSDMTQRNGRIIRQGNMNKEVKVFNYVTEGTFDSYLFQTLENKQRFISQIMTSKSPVRSCEDVDEQALSYAEIKALCAGNPLIKEKMDLDVQVAKLKVLKADHQSQKFRLQDKLLTKFPADIQEVNAHIAGLKADAQLAAAHPQGKEEFCGMTIKGVAYDEKKTAGERLVLACSELPNAEEKVIGSYRGFELSLRFDAFRTEYQALLKGQQKYTVPLGNDPLGNIIRLDNSLNSFPERITSAENELTTLHQQQAAAQIEVEKPFPQEEELAEKSARLAELNAQLDVDEKSHEPEQDEEEQEDAPRRPSVLAALEEKSDKPEPVKPFKSYLDKDGDAR